MSDWWAKKLGPATAPRPSQYAPIAPAGLGQNQDRAVGDYMQRAGVYQPPPEQLSEPQFNPGDPNAEISAGDAMRMWQGKEGAKETAKTGNCPECGSHRYFSRSQGSVTNSNTGTVVAPRGECFECGYPNQQGSVDAVVKVVGDTRQAQQGRMMPVGSLESLQSR